MAVYGYIFCLSQEKPAAVPPAEEAALRRYAAGLGAELTEIVVEAGMGLASPFRSRPGGGRLLAQCRAGDCIISLEAAWVLGCLGEARALLERLRQARVSLHAVDLGGDISLAEKRRLAVSEGPAAMVEKLLAALVDGPGENRSEAIRAGKQARKEAGKYLGGPVPFGRKVDPAGHLVDDPGEQGLIRTIVAWRADRYSYREIARKLAEEHGVRLSHEGVRRIVLAASPAGAPPGGKASGSPPPGGNAGEEF